MTERESTHSLELLVRETSVIALGLGFVFFTEHSLGQLFASEPFRPAQRRYFVASSSFLSSHWFASNELIEPQPDEIAPARPLLGVDRFYADLTALLVETFATADKNEAARLRLDFRFGRFFGLALLV